jgi:hypothetical protein
MPRVLESISIGSQAMSTAVVGRQVLGNSVRDAGCCCENIGRVHQVLRSPQVKTGCAWSDAGEGARQLLELHLR